MPDIGSPSNNIWSRLSFGGSGGCGCAGDNACTTSVGNYWGVGNGQIDGRGLTVCETGVLVGAATYAIVSRNPVQDIQNGIAGLSGCAVTDAIMSQD